MVEYLCSGTSSHPEDPGKGAALLTSVLTRLQVQLWPLVSRTDNWGSVVFVALTDLVGYCHFSHADILEEAVKTLLYLRHLKPMGTRVRSFNCSFLSLVSISCCYCNRCVFSEWMVVSTLCCCCCCCSCSCCCFYYDRHLLVLLIWPSFLILHLPCLCYFTVTVIFIFIKVTVTTTVVTAIMTCHCHSTFYLWKWSLQLWSN